MHKWVTGMTEDYQVKNEKNGKMLNIGESTMTNYVFIVGIEFQISKSQDETC